MNRIAPLLLLLLLCALPTRAQDDRPGSTHIFITYRCDPANRPAALKGMREEGARLFETWRSAGRMESFELIFNTVVDDNTWDVMAVLRFDRFRDTERWRALEETHPGGLTPELARIIRPTRTYFADLKWDRTMEGIDRDTTTPIYVVIPYTWKDKAVYTNYASVYVVPAFDRWITEGALKSYRIFYNCYPTGSVWSGLLVLEYRGTEGLAIRDKTKQKVRGQLGNDPAFKFMQENKKDVRAEHEVVIARVIATGGLERGRAAR